MNAVSLRSTGAQLENGRRAVSAPSVNLVGERPNGSLTLARRLGDHAAKVLHGEGVAVATLSSGFDKNLLNAALAHRLSVCPMLASLEQARVVSSES